MNKYRPDIDGLRAIAILPVLIFHFFPAVLPGGFAGVDVFFVISGYLISSNMLEELHQGTFSYKDFYARRIKRLFPALILVFVCSLVFGMMYLFPPDLTQLGKHIFSGSVFTSNLTLLSEVDYLDLSAELKPFLHLWSLAIEEQFYIIWPIVLSFLSLRPKYLLNAIMAGTIISFGLNVAFLKGNPSAVFYLPFFRFWEILAGAILAYFESQHGITQKSANVRSFLGFLLIALGIGFIKNTSAFPGWWALLPVVGAVLMISAQEGWWNKKILGHKWPVLVGLISYPLYLWHWPVIVFFRLTQGIGPDSLTAFSLMLVSVLMAYLTYRFVEKPLKKFKPSRIVLSLSGSMVAVSCLGITLMLKHGFPERFPLEIRQIANITDPVNYFSFYEKIRLHVCHEVHDQELRVLEGRCISQGKNGLIFLWGDSFAASLYPGLKKLAESQDMGLAQFTAGNAPPFFGEGKLSHGPTLTDFAKRNIALVKKYRPKIIVLNWYFKAKNAPDSSSVKPKLNQVIGELRDASPNSQIIILGPVPQWEVDLNKAYLLYWNKTKTLLPKFSNFKTDKRVNDYDQMLKLGTKNLPVKYISPLKYLCNEDGCITRLDEIPDSLTYVDFGHLTARGSEYLMQSLSQEITSF